MTARALYFDIDGTLLALEQHTAKPVLANGAFERAVRELGFDRAVCVGNFVAIVRTIWTTTPDFDGLGALFSLCDGVFQDERWFRTHIQLAADPERRVLEIDQEADWWFVDDEAARYFRAASQMDVFERERGRRVCVPAPTGDGQDILEWMARGLT
jgi:hypothetical protein